MNPSDIVYFQMDFQLSFRHSVRACDKFENNVIWPQAIAGAKHAP